MFCEIAHRRNRVYELTVIALLAAVNAVACSKPQVRGPVVVALKTNERAGVAVTQPAFEFSHVVNADTAILLRGASDADVIFDAITAGTRVRQIGESDNYLRVVTADGRDGLVDRSRLREIRRPPARSKAVADADQPTPLQPPPADGSIDYATYWPGNVPSADCPSRAQIESAIDRARRYLYARQMIGIWDAPAANGAPQVITNTTLVLNALMFSGENARNPNLSAALKFVQANVPADTFTAAWRNQLCTFLPPKNLNAFIGSNNLIVAAERPGPKPAGLFGPAFDDDNFDVLSTYHGVLGLVNLSNAGVEIPTRIWTESGNALRKRQMAHGGWDAGLSGQKTGETFVATAAGFLALQAIDDALPTPGLSECRGDLVDPNMAAAIRRLDQFLTKPLLNVPPCEAAYWVERIGDSAGRKYLGGKDWFSDFARNLVDNQKPDGSWAGDVCETAFGLMFLCRGNAPILVNKLAYTSAAEKSAWNERPNDVSHLVAWVARQACEIDANWQVVSVDAPTDDWLEAPILYISDNRELSFSDSQIAKLRDYVNRGGLILGNADCESSAFANSFQGLGRKMFPKYEFRPLPADHLIFNEMYHASKWQIKPKVLAMSNGVRELMVLLPDGDRARHWQERNVVVRASSFELGANLVLYVTEKQIDFTKADRRFRNDR